MKRRRRSTVTPSCACGETPFPEPVCITVPGAGPARGLRAAGPDHLQADGPSGTGEQRGRHLGTFLPPAVLPRCVAAQAVSALLAQVITRLINGRKNIGVIGTTAAAAANISHGQRKQHRGEAARGFHGPGSDGAWKGVSVGWDPPSCISQKGLCSVLCGVYRPPSLCGRCSGVPAGCCRRHEPRRLFDV